LKSIFKNNLKKELIFKKNENYNERFLFFYLWICSLIYNMNKGNEELIEVLYAFPGQLLIIIGYYAICNVCYRILFISNWENEYDDLMSQLEEGRKFFEKKVLNIISFYFWKLSIF